MKMNIKPLVIMLSAFLLQSAEGESKHTPILVEAEAFSSYGGWVLDPQFMDIMGSPYLLAHGLGRPVADATTEVDSPAPGTYRVWVRTKDWVAQWKAPGAPGKFQVHINGKALEPTFGTVGAEWRWQDGGSVELPVGKVAVALRDLTGFEGRCDAILLTRDTQFVPPNKDPEMAVFRRACLGQPEQPETAGEFDLVVTGGGIAGTCAALSAARLGLKVALIQDRPVLGGNNSSEVRVWLQGARNKEPWPRIGDVVAELEQAKSAHYGPSNTGEIYEDEKKLALVRAETNITLVLEHRVNGAAVEEGRISSVIAQSTRTGRRQRFVGKYFADCTGDASVGALAGADFEMEPKGHMGPCNLWNVAPTQEKVSFPRCPWALDLSDKPFPGRGKGKADPGKLGGWYWESGFDWDPMQEMESVRDWNFRAMYGAWDALKNVDKVLPDYTLNWSAHILGKRESRRLMGDVVLMFADLTSDRQFPDPAAPTGWSNDLHLPDPKYVKGFEGKAFISHALFGEFPAYKEKRPFWVPYRALYSRNIGNLFMAGRCISVKHEALGAVRVMRTGGCMGEVVGMAASLCVKHDATPRAVYEKHLSELQEIMRRGTGKPTEQGSANK
jgi:FAD dependent oxidoreductase